MADGKGVKNVDKVKVLWYNISIQKKKKEAAATRRLLHYQKIVKIAEKTLDKAEKM